MEHIMIIKNGEMEPSGFIFKTLNAAYAFCEKNEWRCGQNAEYAIYDEVEDEIITKEG